jgi:hypothetical protein
VAIGTGVVVGVGVGVAVAVADGVGVAECDGGVTPPPPPHPVAATQSVDTRARRNTACLKASSFNVQNSIETMLNSTFSFPYVGRQANKPLRFRGFFVPKNVICT